MLTGQNGILNRAAEAKEKNKNANEIEKIELIITSLSLKNYNRIEIGDLEEACNNEFGIEKVKVIDNNDNTFIVKSIVNAKEYYIDSDMTLYDNVKIINSEEEFVEFRNEVNNGNGFDGSYIILNKDIYLENNNEWIPIGIYENDSNLRAFNGIFDGKNHYIQNINISNDLEYQGLFGYNCGIVKNVIISNGSINSKQRSGGLCGLNSGEIINCINESVIIDGKGVGIAGVVGKNEGTIKKCKNYIDIDARIGRYIGGIAGVSIGNGIIMDCQNYGNITAKDMVGGCVGQIGENSKIEESVNVGIITATNGSTGSYVGGIAGQCYGKINYCYNIGDISGNGLSIGGISGEVLGGEISNSYNLGDIINVNSVKVYGGICAGCYKNGNIINCYYINNVNKGIYNFSEQSKIEIYVKNEDEMKKESFVNLLNKSGNKFIKDEELVNDGYPILKWQI